MKTQTLTPDMILAKAKRQYKGEICVDSMTEALQKPTLQEAVDVILDDSRYWNGEFANLVPQL